MRVGEKEKEVVKGASNFFFVKELCTLSNKNNKKLEKNEKNT